MNLEKAILRFLSDGSERSPVEIWQYLHAGSAGERALKNLLRQGRVIRPHRGAYRLPDGGVILSTDEKAAVRAALSRGEAVSTGHVASHAGLPPDKVRLVLAAMVRAGEAVRIADDWHCAPGAPAAARRAKLPRDIDELLADRVWSVMSLATWLQVPKRAVVEALAEASRSGKAVRFRDGWTSPSHLDAVRARPAVRTGFDAKVADALSNGDPWRTGALAAAIATSTGRVQQLLKRAVLEGRAIKIADGLYLDAGTARTEPGPEADSQDVSRPRPGGQGAAGPSAWSAVAGVLADGVFHSDREIAAATGLRRAAVIACLAFLIERGEAEHVGRRIYRKATPAVPPSGPAGPLDGDAGPPR